MSTPLDRHIELILKYPEMSRQELKWMYANIHRLKTLIRHARCRHVCARTAALQDFQWAALCCATWSLITPSPAALPTARGAADAYAVRAKLAATCLAGLRKDRRGITRHYRLPGRRNAWDLHVTHGGDVPAGDVSARTFHRDAPIVRMVLQALFTDRVVIGVRK